jgi:hypothetical protein
LDSPGGLAALPANIYTLGGAKRGSQQCNQVLGSPAIRDRINGRGVDIVVLVLRRFLLELIDEHLQIGFRDRAEKLIGRVVYTSIISDFLSLLSARHKPLFTTKNDGRCRIGRPAVASGDDAIARA